MKKKHYIIWYILFILAISFIWAISHHLIKLLPTFWQTGTPMFVGWMSCIAYYEIFKNKNS
jgi:amino acid permease